MHLAQVVSHIRGHVVVRHVETHGPARMRITLGSAHDNAWVSDNFNSLKPLCETIDRRRGERAYRSRSFCHDRISIQVKLRTSH